MYKREDPNMGTYTYSHQIFDEEARNSGEKAAASTNGAWKTGHPQTGEL